MSHYWAQFRQIRGDCFRFDTRVYLEETEEPNTYDSALGCIIGKNPGSARPAKRSAQLQPIMLSGDKFLPTVRSIVQKSYAHAGLALPRGGYIQVLNLFYLCNRDLRQARQSLRSHRRPAHCPTEQMTFPWAWFAWGGPDPLLDPLKSRFAHISSQRAFFYAGREQRVINRPPEPPELAKHTQGMPQMSVIQHLASLIT